MWARELREQNTQARLAILHPEQAAGGYGASRSGDRRAGRGVSARRVLWLASRAALLQVLEEASVAEVVDVSTEEDQFGVDVIGHTVVGGHCVAYNGWHNEGGGTVEHAVPTASHQGTKSVGGIKNILTKTAIYILHWT